MCCVCVNVKKKLKIYSIGVTGTFFRTTPNFLSSVGHHQMVTISPVLSLCSVLIWGTRRFSVNFWHRGTRSWWSSMVFSFIRDTRDVNTIFFLLQNFYTRNAKKLVRVSAERVVWLYIYVCVSMVLVCRCKMCSSKFKMLIKRHKKIKIFIYFFVTRNDTRPLRFKNKQQLPNKTAKMKEWSDVCV